MSSRSAASFKLIVLTLALVVGAVVYRLLYVGHLEQTAALFIGLPALLAVLLGMTPEAKSATGMILKGLTILLCLSGILLGEGLICILMAAPLFYGIGALIGFAIDRRRQKRGGGQWPLLALLPILPLALEGVHPRLAFDRSEQVRAVCLIHATPSDIERSLAGPLNFDRPVPFYLSLGFPRPRAAWGSGLEPGDYRAVRFTGENEEPGILVVRISRRANETVRFIAMSDTSMVAQWLRWRQVDFRWKPDKLGWTRVECIVSYERRLDPAWYFGPWERYAAGLAADYLAESLTPERP